MYKSAFVLVLLVLVCSSTAFAAWTDYLDGSALPAWDIDAPEGQRSVVDDLGNTAIYMNSWGSYNEYYTQAGVGSTLVMGSRLRVAEKSTSGSEALIEVTANTSSSSAVAFGIKDGLWTVMDYVNGSVLADFGQADNVYHTVYISSAANGVWSVNFDGIETSGIASAVDWGGWAEFGSGSYWQCAMDTHVYFDWVAYGDGSNMPVVPEPSSMAALATALVGFTGVVTRRRK